MKLGRCVVGTKMQVEFEDPCGLSIQRALSHFMWAVLCVTSPLV